MDYINVKRVHLITANLPQLRINMRSLIQLIRKRLRRSGDNIDCTSLLLQSDWPIEESESNRGYRSCGSGKYHIGRVSSVSQSNIRRKRGSIDY